jgi:hypothetical protein
VFLDSGKHTVTVQMFKGTQVLAETKQTVYAETLADKMWVEPRNPKAFRREIAQIDFHKAPIQNVVRPISGMTAGASWRDGGGFCWSG